jgi:hypothetical protein
MVVKLRLGKPVLATRRSPWSKIPDRNIATTGAEA